MSRPERLVYDKRKIPRKVLKNLLVTITGTPFENIPIRDISDGGFSAFMTDEVEYLVRKKKLPPEPQGRIVDTVTGTVRDFTGELKWVRLRESAEYGIRLVCGIAFKCHNTDR